MIAVLGPTACGKTRYAAHLAAKIDGEIISADSRQVFRGMDIGTGKDLNEYCVDGKNIPFHLIDIRNPGEEYSVFDFVSDFQAAYQSIVSRKKTPILCGGTGLYLSAVLQHYQFSKVPFEQGFHDEMQQFPHTELIARLQTLKPTHNTSDFETKARTIRAIEIALHSQNPVVSEFPKFHCKTVFAIFPPRDEVRMRISKRLVNRLNAGLVEEVEGLIKLGIPPQRLLSYGLEYKFVTLYLLGTIHKTELFEQLNIAIRQFAKRQMTWFRKMQREGVKLTIVEPLSS